MTPHQFTNYAAQVCQVDPDTLRSPSRKPCLVDIRRMISAVLSARHYKLQEIAESIGRRNHTTVINLLDTHKDFLKVDPAYRKSFIDFQRKAGAFWEEFDISGVETLAIIGAAKVGLV